MYIPTLIIILLVIVFLYFIFKRKTPAKVTYAETREEIQKQIIVKEKFTLDTIRKRDLKEDIKNGSESALFECGKHNFSCLDERFKHDDVKHQQAVKDWFDYMELLRDRVYEMDILHYLSDEDSQEHLEKREQIDLRLREICRRFKNLLGGDYWDIEELQKIRQKS